MINTGYNHVRLFNHPFIALGNGELGESVLDGGIHGSVIEGCIIIAVKIRDDKSAYNEFVTKRPQGESAVILQQTIERLKREERELAELRMQRLIPEDAFREEQRRIKAQIEELNKRYTEQRTKTVRESGFTIITEYSDEKVEKFITSVVITKGVVTFTFYNGVEISRDYNNGQAGNKVGWNKKEA